MTNDTNRRRHARLVHRALVKVTYSSGNSEQLKMNDFSESGLFIFCPTELPQLGDLMSVQTLELDDAPVLKTKVVRLIPGKGFALEFIL
ncbi:MAG: PilZ domain-containing protein [Methylicorpusculum sp.]|uniref:PilZ domain-containing protein n=1 Tax=Methylicorpusculum sp. TaxID=2713644 RepID=UPI0027162167|nr:PilZ domain-containing protein [Methylicorpusculum sp.]MDO8845991.1 PilZ domain-containing protein [Methylicorpusculum sp.]MDO8938520.1 PilZ domain-containing protein [Methylicorpusculum sp.]MDO9238928.1 PilZ domain-containing protein [Methylicorpusculum sp.]MDP2177120.1 PilZ domain-containing protein [Methylicorpusculum sp.]MDP2202070.1 PilZ domain-containing protein [Methylicorpusculum sp.]